MQKMTSDPRAPRARRAHAASLVTIETANGILQGLRSHGVDSFRGVPYAADTGGSNRFRAPQPVTSWTGFRPALQYGDRCLQADGFAAGKSDWIRWYQTNSRHSENCCVLNLYSAGAAAGSWRPVMVYLHGGGFVSGGGDGPALDGSNLATFGDVVVVTLNHRLNLLGYMPLGHLDPDFADSANSGMLDIIAALE